MPWEIGKYCKACNRDADGLEVHLESIHFICTGVSIKFKVGS